MTEKAPMAFPLLDGDKATPLISAYFEIAHLKQVYRKGWLQRGLPESLTESVADHSFGNAILCLLLLANRPELDAAKVLRLALLHDVGEAYVGDITPQDRVDSSEKTRLESEAVTKILSRLPGGNNLIADWHEYEEQASPEAQFVKQVDRLELAMQASIYSHQGEVDVPEFIDAALAHARDDDVASEVEMLKALTRELSQVLDKAGG